MTGRMDGEWIIANEFAQVRLTVDTNGNDPRLCIEDLATERRIYLDAFELARYMDPNPRSET
jgi:hypothetical protein